MHRDREAKDDPCHDLPPGLKGRLIGQMLHAIPFRKVDASMTNPVAFAGCYPNNLIVHTDTLFDETKEALFLSSKPDLISGIIVVEAFILNGWFKYRSSLKPGGVPKEGQPVETACVGLPYQLIAICDFRRDLSLMFHCVSQGDPAFLGLAGASDVYVVAVKNADFTPCNEC
jgi:hypothetical protein